MVKTWSPVFELQPLIYLKRWLLTSAQFIILFRPKQLKILAPGIELGIPSEVRVNSILFAFVEDPTNDGDRLNIESQKQ